MTRPTLRRSLAYTTIGVTSASLVAFTASLLVYFHNQVHAQTDALLLEMAHLEAHDLRREHDQPVHIHDAGMGVHGLHGHLAHKHGLILSAEDCKVLAHTSNLDPARVPRELCKGLAPGQWRHLNLEGPAPYLLRGAALSAPDARGKPMIFFVGVEHDQIDSATWETTAVATLLGLLVLLLVTAVSLWLSRRLTGELGRLEQACRQLDTRTLGAGEPLPSGHFSLSDQAPRELAVLSETLEALVRRLSALLRSQHNFLAEAAHELRTPVTSLRGELEVTLRRQRSAQEYREALELAHQDTMRLGHLSEHLLEAMRAQVEELPLEESPLEPLLTDSLARVLGQARDAGTELVLEPGAQKLSAWLHPLSTSRVLDNLLRNALEHAQATQVRLRAQIQGDWVEILLEDNGQGVSPKAQASLFEPFGRGSQRPGSHGMGLYISRELMRRQGGDLDYLPGPQGGARWRLRLARRQRPL